MPNRKGSSRKGRKPSSTVTLEKVAHYWQVSRELTHDLTEDQRFSAPGLVEYSNKHLPQGCQEITKIMVDYLRGEGILIPEKTGTGENRMSWRYTPTDVLRTLVAQILKDRENASVQEIKGWLRSYDEIQQRGLLPARGTRAAATEIPSPPAPYSQAWALLRNRALGTLITSLGRGVAQVTPPHCLIALRPQKADKVAFQRPNLPWEEARQLLETGTWHLAAVDSNSSLYIYENLKDLQAKGREGTDPLSDYAWYHVTLQDAHGQRYEVVLGLPPRSAERRSISNTLARQERGSPLALSEFPGLSTLVRAAFANDIGAKEGTPLHILAEFIASASDAWDNCAILALERSDNGTWGRLVIQGHSSRYPRHPIKTPTDVKEDNLLSWCYRYRKEMIVDHVIQGDPRLSFYEDIPPSAAAAVPAIAAGDEGPQIVGVLYIGREKPVSKGVEVFSDELKASLKEFGYVCGDALARERIEVETVRGIVRLSTRPWTTYQPSTFSDLEGLAQAVAKVVREEVKPEKAAHSWIYLLTLNIAGEQPLEQVRDVLRRWWDRHAIEVAREFLSNRLWDPPRQDTLPIGQCEVGPGKFVYAVLRAIDLPEEKYKERLMALQQKLNVSFPWLHPEYYPWGVTFPYEHLRRDFVDNQGSESAALEEHLAQVTRGALTAGPHISRGHEAWRNGNVKLAVKHFKRAVEVAPDNWYAYKHLAEYLMLDKEIKEAIKQCKEALERNPRYASARCLLADCLSNDGKYGPALVEYERSLKLDPTRPDFRIRYGIALAGMSESQYLEAKEHYKRTRNYPEEGEPVLDPRAFQSQPYDEAIIQFEEAEKLSSYGKPSEEQSRRRRDEYYYHRGLAYLQAEQLDRAVTEFELGRRDAPDDLRMAQAYVYALKLKHPDEKQRLGSLAQVEDSITN